MNDFFYIGKGNITEKLIREFLDNISKDYSYFGHRCTQYSPEKQKSNVCHIQYYDVSKNPDNLSMMRVDISVIESFIRDKKIDNILK